MKLKQDTPIFLALVVKDLERSVAFYRDTLGMEEIKGVVVPDEKAAAGHFSQLGFAFRTFRLGPLALKLVTVKTDPRSTAGEVDTFTGVRYIAFVVEDLDATCQLLGQRGVSFLSPVLPPEPAQQVLRLVFFRDPDGNLLELYGA